MEHSSSSGQRRSLPAGVRALLTSSTSNREAAHTILSDLSGPLLQHRILHSASRLANNSANVVTRHGDSAITQALVAIGRAPSRLLLPSSRSSSSANSLDLAILEQVDELLSLPVPSTSQSANAQAIEASAGSDNVSLIAGFKATAPAASTARTNRRKKRAGLIEAHLGIDPSQQSLGLRAKSNAARGLLQESIPEEEESDGMSSSGLLGSRRSSIPATPNKRKYKKGGRKSMAALGYQAPAQDNAVPESMSPEELQEEVREIELDRANLGVRKVLLNSEIGQVDAKIAALEAIRADLKRGLLHLREEELELDDELEGVQERLAALALSGTANTSSSLPSSSASATGSRAPSTSRRRKGPAFLPSEHDQLPKNVAFLTLTGHESPITALDFSEPYGFCVTASGLSSSNPSSATQAGTDHSVRIWDLTTGDQLTTLNGHAGPVKALQVESNVCVTGGTDGKVMIWDLDKAEEGALLNTEEEEEGEGACVKSLEAHTKDVTCLYFDGSCLVTGSSDKTLRQWDMNTGQCVVTMDILWAISNPSTSQSFLASPPPSPSANRTSRSSFPLGSPSPTKAKRPSLGDNLRRLSSNNFLLNDADDPFTPVPAFAADGSWEMYQDFVGGVQFWGYALASGSADGCVRMWDMRTGQAHRTLVGHTMPVTCLQFDEQHLISGSLDKSIRIWDLRTGGIEETIRYDGPITALQFDSRKIVTAAGENGANVYNRTTLQNDTLTLNGHTGPVERLRFMDRYLATGSKDCTVKIWSLG